MNDDPRDRLHDAPTDTADPADDPSRGPNNTGWWLLLGGGLLTFALIAWGTASLLSPADEPVVTETPTAAPTAEVAEGAAHIAATLFFGSPDGLALVPLQREVALGGSVVEQGQHILAAQLQGDAPAPYVSVIPPGTTLRAFYVTDRGDAFVDLSAELVNGHPGGSQYELLTVYAIVHAVTANLPAARRVQILVDGMEVDTIAGHVDLRRPLAPDPSLVRQN